MVFQFHCLFEHLSAIHNVCLAPVHAHGVAPADAARRGAGAAAGARRGHRAAALPRELSGGEAQRVAIARALAVDPPLLLMDEPTASLDPARRNELGGLLQGLQRQQRTLVVTTHDDDFARDFATRIVRLKDGRVVPASTQRTERISKDTEETSDAPTQTAGRPGRVDRSAGVPSRPSLPFVSLFSAASISLTFAARFRSLRLNFRFGATA